MAGFALSKIFFVIFGLYVQGFFLGGVYSVSVCVFRYFSLWLRKQILDETQGNDYPKDCRRTFRGKIWLPAQSHDAWSI